MMAARVRHEPAPSTHTPLPGLTSTLSTVVLTAIVGCAPQGNAVTADDPRRSSKTLEMDRIASPLGKEVFALPRGSLLSAPTIVKTLCENSR